MPPTTVKTPSAELRAIGAALRLIAEHITFHGNETARDEIFDLADDLDPRPEPKTEPQPTE